MTEFFFFFFDPGEGDPILYINILIFWSFRGLRFNSIRIWFNFASRYTETGKMETFTKFKNNSRKHQDWSSYIYRRIKYWCARACFTSAHHIYSNSNQSFHTRHWLRSVKNSSRSLLLTNRTVFYSNHCYTRGSNCNEIGSSSTVSVDKSVQYRPL